MAHRTYLSYRRVELLCQKLIMVDQRRAIGTLLLSIRLHTIARRVEESSTELVNILLFTIAFRARSVSTSAVTGSRAGMNMICSVSTRQTAASPRRSARLAVHSVWLV
jgi:hypothetical protein